MSIRHKLLSALNCENDGPIPCSFMLFNGLKSECSNYLEFIQRQIDLGLHPYVQIPPRPPIVVNDHYNLHGLPVSYHPDVVTREWKETQAGQHNPILVKEYLTPAGILRTEVRQDDEWRWGDHVPFLDDYLVGRSNKFIIDGPDDLDALRYLLVVRDRHLDAVRIGACEFIPHRHVIKTFGGIFTLALDFDRPGPVPAHAPVCDIDVMSRPVG